MISVNEALSLIDREECSQQAIQLPIDQCLGRYLATDIFSPLNMPPFRQSAMDGYAIIHSQQNERSLVGELKAGDQHHIDISVAECVRVFTGSSIPDSADTVVMQEHISRVENRIVIDQMPRLAANVRRIGEQLSEGDLVFSRHDVLNEAGIGMLASMGLESVKVYDTPLLGLISTGDELKSPGSELAFGQIFESNSYMLRAALKRLHIHQVDHYVAKDTYQATVDTLTAALEHQDVILVSGGISVGDYDFVRPALEACGVEMLFYKVAQKPGKPLWVGRKEDKWVFALPGNPASSLTCFYIYVLPVLRRMMGSLIPRLNKRYASMSVDFNHKGGKTLFLKAIVNGSEITVLSGQQSSMLHSFSKANALAVIPPDKPRLQSGTEVEYYDLNF